MVESRKSTANPPREDQFQLSDDFETTQTEGLSEVDATDYQLQLAEQSQTLIENAEALEVELLVEAHLIHAAQVKLREKIARRINAEENEAGLLMHPIVDYLAAIPLIKVN